MKALTVRQPWAWAIVHGGKDTENRDWRPRKMPDRIAVHAGKARDDYAFEFIEHLTGELVPFLPGDPAEVLGAIIGTAKVRDWHPVREAWCCQPWGMPDSLFHVVLADIRPCEPIPCRGGLGLWAVPDDVASLLGGGR